MQQAPGSVSLAQLPAAVLGHIARLSHWQHVLRRTCVALRLAITPERITIDYLKVSGSQQDLHLSRQLALTWREVTHVDVLTQNFRTAKKADDLNRIRASSDRDDKILFTNRDDHDVQTDLEILAATYPQTELKHTKRSIAQHMFRLKDFFNRAVSALVYWRHLQTACIPLDSSMVCALLAQCCLKSLELSDKTFENVDDDFPEVEAVRPQVGACLLLLQGRESLKKLKLDLRVARLDKQHLQLLAQLTQLEDLDLVVRDKLARHELVLIDTTGIMSAVRHLKQLVSLRLDLRDFCSPECVVDLGDMPALRSISLDLMERGEDSSVTKSSLFEGCPRMEKVVLRAGVFPDGPMNWSGLHYLTHIDLNKTTLDDPVLTALASCSQLAHLTAGPLCVTNAFAAVLRVLRELHIPGVEKCEVPFRVFAPQLRSVSCMSPGALIALQDHPTLSSVHVHFLCMPAPCSQLQRALASLTSVQTVRVSFDVLATASMKYTLAPSLAIWAAGIQELQLTGGLDFMRAWQLLLLLKSMTGLRVLRVLGCYKDGLRYQRNMADAIVWALTSISGRGARHLQLVELDMRWLMFERDAERDGSANVGWVPYLIALLVGLAPAPSLKLVRLVHPGKAFEGMREGAKEHDLFREIWEYVESAHQMESLQFHVEVV